MKPMKELLRKAIIAWYDDSMYCCKGLDNPEFVSTVCKSLEMTEEEYKKLVLEPSVGDSDADLISDDMLPSEIFVNLSEFQKDSIYQMVLSDRIAEDAESFIYEKMGRFREDFIAEVIDAVANAYVYNGEYKNERPYWDNIKALIDKEMATPDEKVFQFLYESSEEENGVGNITYKVSGPIGIVEAAAWLWEATIDFSNAVFKEGNTRKLLAENYDNEQINYLYKMFSGEAYCDPVAAYNKVITIFKEMGLTVEDCDDTDEPDIYASHGVY